MGLVVDDRLGCIVRIEAWSPAAKSGVGTGWVVLHHGDARLHASFFWWLLQCVHMQPCCARMHTIGCTVRIMLTYVYEFGYVLTLPELKVLWTSSCKTKSTVC